MWVGVLSGSGLAAILLIGYEVRQYLKERQPRGKHAMTAEILTMVHETAPGYADYTTAEQPRVEDAVKTTVLPPVPAPRTDTVLMEAVNPADHPEKVAEILGVNNG